MALCYLSFVVYLFKTFVTQLSYLSSDLVYAFVFIKEHNINNPQVKTNARNKNIME